jgi:hypothetical protein
MLRGSNSLFAHRYVRGESTPLVGTGAAARARQVRLFDKPFLSPLVVGWWLALAGLLCGAWLTVYGLYLESGAVAVLGFALLYRNLDQELMPELPFGPGSLIFLFHALGFGLGPLAQRYLIGHTTFIEAGFVQAQWGSVIGLASFALVYPLVFRGLDTNGGNREFGTESEFVSISDRYWKAYALLLWSWVVLIILFGFLTGVQRRVGGTEGISLRLKTLVAMFLWARQVCWFFLGFCAARFRRKWFWFWLASLGMYSVYVFLDGSRGWVVHAAFFSVLGAAVAGVSRRRLAIGLLIFAVVFSPFADIVSDYRQGYAGGALSVEDRIDHFAETVEGYFADYKAGGLGWFNTILFQSTAHTADLIFLLTPDRVPFANFDDLGRLLYAFIPRVLLPDRPTLEDGGEIACEYGVIGGRANPGPRCGAGDYTPTVGEGYRRLGWLGIPLLYGFQAVLIGFILRQVWAKRGRVEWAAMFVVVVYVSTRLWSMTLLTLLYHVIWVFPKYFVFFWVMRWIVDAFEGPDRLGLAVSNGS